MQAHHGGDGEESHRKLMKEWRDGALQQYYSVPLENVFVLNETRLLKELKYTPAELTATIVYMVAAGALIEAANIKIGETVVIGPSGGSFGGAAIEVALAMGANVVALGRNEEKLMTMKERLGKPDRLQFVAMTGHVDKDSAAIRKATPGGAGFEVYTDWTPGEDVEPLYLPAAALAIKGNGRIVMSGSASGTLYSLIPCCYTRI
ncbi:hypothetical protein T440DRAFT_521012 [Plenodomus tracheiphilus IPT5]|uniref:NAD(P)-binding protein n=1 Tax=Plenodomus tracheiphilus IPT5 TaxID=1408161 RepID=A0A6A7AYL8_9PLEO|nr:hypothetical protein T440DRAFT_521012 [Plenodomus tracheiphilus IPT5]